MKWCEHMKPGKLIEVDKENMDKTFMFCPYCGKERPKNKFHPMTEHLFKGMQKDKGYTRTSLNKLVKSYDEPKELEKLWEKAQEKCSMSIEDINRVDWKRLSSIHIDEFISLINNMKVEYVGYMPHINEDELKAKLEELR